MVGKINVRDDKKRNSCCCRQATAQTEPGGADYDWDIAEPSVKCMHPFLMTKKRLKHPAVVNGNRRRYNGAQHQYFSAIVLKRTHSF